MSYMAYCFDKCGNPSTLLPVPPDPWGGGTTPPIDPTVIAVTCPTIPSTAVAGATPTIRVIGQNFTAACKAYLDNVLQTTTMVSATELTFVGTSPIAKTSTIQVKDGTTPVPSTCQFVWTAAPILTVVCPVVPATAVAGTADVVVTVNGTLFTPTTVGTLNGVDQVTTPGGATSLSFTVPVSTYSAAATLQIGARDGANTALVTCPFTITAAPLIVPTIATVLPDYIGRQGPTVTITVTGTNFDATSKVTYNGVEELPTTLVSPTQLTAVWDPNVTMVGGFQIRVANGPFSNSSPTAVLVNCVHNPTVSMLDIASVPSGGAAPTTVKVVGSYYGDTAKVLVDGVEVATNRLSGGTLEFSMPPSATPAVKQISVRLGHDHPPHDNVTVMVPPLSLPFTYT